MELILDQAQLCLVGLYMVCLISFSSLFGSFFLYSMKRINILEITQMHLNITIIDIIITIIDIILAPAASNG